MSSSLVHDPKNNTKEKAVANEEFYKLKYCSTVVYMVPRA